MALPLHLPFSPMEAFSVDQIPIGKEWRYEPKWDGFRCLVFSRWRQEYRGLQSKSGRPLTRYFPELVAALRRLGSRENSYSMARSPFPPRAHFRSMRCCSAFIPQQAASASWPTKRLQCSSSLISSPTLRDGCLPISALDVAQARLEFLLLADLPHLPEIPRLSRHRAPN